MTTSIRAKVAAIVEQLDAVASLHPATSHLLRHLATDGQAALRGDEVPLDVVSAALTRWYAAGMPDLDRPGSNAADGPAAPGIRAALERAYEALDRAFADLGNIVEHGNRAAEDHGLKVSMYILEAQEHIEAAQLALGGPVPSPEREQQLAVSPWRNAVSDPPDEGDEVIMGFGVCADLHGQRWVRDVDVARHEGGRKWRILSSGEIYGSSDSDWWAPLSPLPPGAGPGVVASPWRERTEPAPSPSEAP